MKCEFLEKYLNKLQDESIFPIDSPATGIIRPSYPKTYSNKAKWKKKERKENWFILLKIYY